MNTITLKPECAFYDLFPNGMVPVRFALPVPCILEGIGEARCYFLDGDALSSEQMEAVAGRCAELSGARVSDIRDELMERGMPIREAMVAVAPGISQRMLA